MLLPAAGLFVLSLAFSLQSGNINVNEALASGPCCTETGSICSLDGHHYEDKYYKYQGPCKTQVEPTDQFLTDNTADHLSVIDASVR